MEDLNSADVVDIVCRNSVSATGCKGTFKASPSFWAGFKDKDGNPYSTQKSCDVCRQYKRDTEHIRPSSTSSMVTAVPFSTMVTTVPSAVDDNNSYSLVAAAIELDITDSGPHDNDGADDFYYGYDMSMSEASEAQEQ